MHYHTSAKHNHNIEEMFFELTQRMISHAEEVEKRESLTRPNNNGHRRNVVVVEDPETEEQNHPPKSSCCGSSSG